MRGSLRVTRPRIKRRGEKLNEMSGTEMPGPQGSGLGDPDQQARTMALSRLGMILRGGHHGDAALPGAEAHTQNIERAVNDVRSPDVASNVSTSRRKYRNTTFPGLNLGWGERASSSGTTWVAVLQLHHCDRPIGLQHIPGRVFVYRGKTTARYQVNRLYTPGGAQVPDDLAAFIVDVGIDVMNELTPLERDAGASVVSGRPQENGIAALGCAPFPNAHVVSLGIGIQAFLLVHVRQIAVEQKGRMGACA